jgi:hypothetical protein
LTSHSAARFSDWRSDRNPARVDYHRQTVTYPRSIPRDEQSAKELKKRTLTNLYNPRPAWLDNIHRQLDQAVFAAYGWSPDLSDDDLLAKLLELNLQRAETENR